MSYVTTILVLSGLRKGISGLQAASLAASGDQAPPFPVCPGPSFGAGGPAPKTLSHTSPETFSVADIIVMFNFLIGWCLNNRFLVSSRPGVHSRGMGTASATPPVDAIPDIGEKQVIVYADWPGRSPQDIEDQVTYPLTVGLQGTPGVKSIRSMSGFGFSMVFVVFKDEAEYYWARSRVLERMNVAAQKLPQGVTPVLGPDATALGQVFWYTLEADGADLADLRSIQDWYVRYQLQSVEGVSEVATLGGFLKQYQIDVDPDKMRAHRVTLPDVYEAVRKSNIDVGANVVENNGLEFFIRGVGFVKTVADLENIVIRQEGGTPIFVKNVATVQLGPDFRRGVLDNAGRSSGWGRPDALRRESVGGHPENKGSDQGNRAWLEDRARRRQADAGQDRAVL